MKKLLVLAIVLALVLPLFAAGAKEETIEKYPSRTVRVIIPWSVGGMTDVLTRPVASHLEKQFGVPFVVENKPGGGGVVGSLEIEKAANDGYVIGTTSMSTVSAKYVSPIYPDIYNVELISQVITIPATVTVNANSPFKTLQDLIDYAKALVGDRMMVFGSAYSVLQEEGVREAESNIRLGYADFAGWGRQTLSDPLFPKRLALGDEVDYCKLCSGCSKLMIKQEEVGCIIYPSLN